MQSTVRPLQAAFDKVTAAERLLADAADILCAPLMGQASFKLGKRAKKARAEAGAMRFRIEQLGAPHVKDKTLQA